MLDGIVHRSDMYIASGSAVRSPCLNAVVGVEGDTSTSTWVKAASKSSAIRRRTFCAEP